MSSRAVILEVFVRGLYPFMTLLSLWVLLRGHNNPGGGFIGGLVAVAATAVVAVAQGTERAMARFPLAPLSLAASGTLLALLSGLPALVVGQPYMTHLWTEVPLGLTRVPVSTVQLFDLGVYGTVWGALGGLAVGIIALDEGASP